MRHVCLTALSELRAIRADLPAAVTFVSVADYSDGVREFPPLSRVDMGTVD